MINKKKQGKSQDISLFSYFLPSCYFQYIAANPNTHGVFSSAILAFYMQWEISNYTSENNTNTESC